MATSNLNELPAELINIIIDHLPHEKIFMHDPHKSEKQPDLLLRDAQNSSSLSYNNTLRELCLTSQRLNDICTPRLYHTLVEETQTLARIIQGRQLLLLLRTLIRKPGLGAFIRNVTASTWQSLDTDCLSEDDMKAVFEQTERITSMYPWQIDIPVDGFGPKSVCQWQEKDAPLCNLHCGSKPLLQSHVETAHTAALCQDSYVCRWSGCSRLALRSGNFFWKYALHEHLKSHTGLAGVECPVCHFKFSSSRAVEVHLQEHIDEIAFSCEEPGCDYQAELVSVLRMHTLLKHNREAFEVDKGVGLHERDDEVDEVPSSAPVLAFQLQDRMMYDTSHPLSDFPFCSALAWSHAIRRGEWDAIFAFLLSYLPNMESLTIQDPDAGVKCPFSQCTYLTTFMERVTLSQRRRRHLPSTIKGLQQGSVGRAKTHELTGSSINRPAVVSRKRKCSQSGEPPCSGKRRHMMEGNTSETLPCALQAGRHLTKDWLAETHSLASVIASQANAIRRLKALQPPPEPLLPRLRSIALDCMYRSADVHFADVMPFLFPESVEDFSCSYLVDDQRSILELARLNLKAIKIRNGQLRAATVADLIRSCLKLESFSFEVGGACEFAYQTIFSPDVKKALDAIAGTLEHLDLLKSDMNYWRPSYDVSRLEGHTGFTFNSFKNFTRLKRLYLKAETMVRHSESDPEADTAPLWGKLPPSLEELRLAGNEKYFANLIPQVQELLEKKEVAVPRLRVIVLTFRREYNYDTLEDHGSQKTVIVVRKDNVAENQVILANLLEQVVKDIEGGEQGADHSQDPHNL